MFLLVDNLEHLLAAAPALGELLAQAKGLRLLVTSRTPLRVRGEREYPLDPLAEDAAVTLFVERARDAGRDLEPDETIAAICRRLDSLPLAIELAAARTKILAPAKLLERLEQALPILTGGARDAPERQQTLRATIEWSYDRLDTDAQQLFARLAVFAGTFPLEAAEDACDATLDALTALVDLSLLKPVEDSRFLMLETIGEFAARAPRGLGRRRRGRSPACGVVPRARRGGRAVPDGSRAARLAATPGRRARQPPREPRLVLRPRRRRRGGEARRGAVAVLVRARPRHRGPPLAAASARCRPGRAVGGPRQGASRRRLPRLRAERERGGARPARCEPRLCEGARRHRFGRDHRRDPLRHQGRHLQQHVRSSGGTGLRRGSGRSRARVRRRLCARDRAEQRRRGDADARRA